MGGTGSTTTFFGHVFLPKLNDFMRSFGFPGGRGWRDEISLLLKLPVWAWGGGHDMECEMVRGPSPIPSQSDPGIETEDCSDRLLGTCVSMSDITQASSSLSISPVSFISHEEIQRESGCVIRLRLVPQQDGFAEANFHSLWANLVLEVGERCARYLCHWPFA
uniref:Uncharacterized protein n=1 Tax=Guillardia theta TaxID=55529 RepID=A0A7S4PGV7_GUITH